MLNTKLNTKKNMCDVCHFSEHHVGRPASVDSHPFLTSCQRNWCLLTTENTESKLCFLIMSRASFKWRGWRHGDVAWMLHTISTSVKSTHRKNMKQLLVLVTRTCTGDQTVGVPGLSLMNSWMVSNDVEESLETSGVLRCTLAPHALATFSISSWSVDTHTLRTIQRPHQYKLLSPVSTIFLTQGLLLCFLLIFYFSNIRTKTITSETGY